jgi:hypothetical protein
MTEDDKLFSTQTINQSNILSSRFERISQKIVFCLGPLHVIGDLNLQLLSLEQIPPKFCVLSNFCNFIFMNFGFSSSLIFELK